MSKNIITYTPIANATTIATTGSTTSEAFLRTQTLGFGSILAVITGTTPSLKITITCGLTETGTFYEPFTSNKQSFGLIVDKLDSTRWIQFEMPLAPFVKFTVTGTSDNGSDTTIQLYYISDEAI